MKEMKKSKIIKDVPLREARVILLGAGNDRGSSEFLGSALAPWAICQALHFDIEEYIHPFGRICDKVGIIEKHLNIRNLRPRAMVEAVEKKVKYLLERNLFVVTIGGSHSVSIGSIRAIEAHKFWSEDKFTVIQLDAHLDLRPDDSDFVSGFPDPYSHCCVMRRVYELQIPFIQVGIRVFSDADVEFLKREDLEKNVFEIRRQDEIYHVINSIPDYNVYLTFDVDILNRDGMPATTIPEPGGWSFEKLNDFLKLLFQKRNVIGFDVVEVCPGKDFSPADRKIAAYNAALLIYQMIGYKFCQ